MANLFGTGVNQVPTNGMLGNMAFQDKTYLSVDKIGIGTTATDTGTANQTLQNYGGAYISGSVGVGTTNPQQKLDIIGNQKVFGKAIIGDSINSANILNTLNANVSTGISAFRSINLIDSNAAIKISRAGGVGLGAIAELQHWDVGLSTNYGYWDFVSEDGYFGIRDRKKTRTRIFIDDTGNVLVGTNAQTLSTNYTQLVGIGTDKILSVIGNTYTSGTVGIGTTSAQSTIHVVGNALISGIATAAQLDLTANATNNDPVLYLTGSAANNSRTGILAVGILTTGASDSGLLANFASAQTDYAQIILQNTNNGTNSSTDFVVNNNISGPSANYGDFGINASGYTQGGPYGDPSGTYLYSVGGTLSIGTNDAQDFRVATGSAAATPVTRMTITGVGGSVGIGTTRPAARLHILGGTAAAGTAPLEINRGTLLTTPESDVFEYDGVTLYHTANNTTTGSGRCVIPEYQYYKMTTDRPVNTATTTGAASTAGGSVFGDTFRPALVGGWNYDFEYNVYVSRATSNGIMSFQWTASAGTISSITAYTISGGGNAAGYVLSGSGTTVVTTGGANLNSGVTAGILIKGTLSCSQDARINLQAFQSAGTQTFLRGSWFKFTPLGIGNTIGNIG